IWQRDYDVIPPAWPVDVALHYKRAKLIYRYSVIAACNMTAFIIALLNFKICGEFMLTEISHGLDARNLETTAMLQVNGSFELHTPTTAASKVMPPITPYYGIPRVAIIFARLMVRGKSQGVKPFIVFLSDADAIRPGLPYNAMLGSPAKPESERAEFLCHIRRVAVRTLSLSIMGISAIRVGTHIAALYSERRTITAPDGHSAMPIIGFSTQQRPIIEGWAVSMCPDPANPMQHALNTIFKATVIKASRVLGELAESELDLTFQGNSIAKGDTLNALTPLAQQEHRLMTEIQSRLTEIGGYGKHRTEAFNQHILPFCRPLVKTIGHRMAYEAAQCSGISPDVLELYERLSTGKALIHLPAQGVSRVRCEDPLVDEQYETIIAVGILCSLASLI
ncbi:hypothetical protein NOF04DRAFT_1327016, partial [Fusarium oxysporum II5]